MEFKMKKTTLTITRWKEKGLSLIIVLSLSFVFVVSLGLLYLGDASCVDKGFYSDVNLILFPLTFLIFWLAGKILINFFNFFKDMEGFKGASFDAPLMISIFWGLFLFLIVLINGTYSERIYHIFSVSYPLVFIVHFFFNLSRMLGYNFPDEEEN
jgi:hypothetical protein